MSQPARLRRQDGFIREIVWLAVIIAIIAVVTLDGLALFGTYRGVLQDASNAADEAQAVYTEVSDMGAAKLAAEKYLAKTGSELVDFSAKTTSDGALYFSVTATGTANTYAFHYLGKIPPLKSWVHTVTHPTRTGESTY